MATAQTVLASASYIVSTVASAAVVENYTFACEPDVVGVQPNTFAATLSSASNTTASFAGGLKVPTKVRYPGVFTAGTAQEGTSSNPTNDSNS